MLAATQLTGAASRCGPLAEGVCTTGRNGSAEPAEDEGVWGMVAFTLKQVGKVYSKEADLCFSSHKKTGAPGPG